MPVGQAQYGVQVALVHQVAANVGAYIALKQHVVGQHHSGAATRGQVAINVLQKTELLVGGGVGKVSACRQATTFFGAKGRIT